MLPLGETFYLSNTEHTSPQVGSLLPLAPTVVTLFVHHQSGSCFAHCVKLPQPELLITDPD